LAIVFLLAIPVAMYFLMIRPQKKRLREQAALQASMGIGDEVVTNSGIYGFITGEEDDKFWLEIDENVQIRIAKVAIQGKVGGDTTVPAVESASPSKEPIDTTAGDDTDDTDSK